MDKKMFFKNQGHNEFS